MSPFLPSSAPGGKGSVCFAEVCRAGVVRRGCSRTQDQSVDRPTPAPDTPSPSSCKKVAQPVLTLLLSCAGYRHLDRWRWRTSVRPELFFHLARDEISKEEEGWGLPHWSKTNSSDIPPLPPSSQTSPCLLVGARLLRRYRCKTTVRCFVSLSRNSSAASSVEVADPRASFGETVLNRCFLGNNMTDSLFHFLTLRLSRPSTRRSSLSPSSRVRFLHNPLQLVRHPSFWVV